MYTKYLFQEESPVLYQLYDEQDDLLKGFLAKFVKAEVIASSEEAKDVVFNSAENQLSDNDIFLGTHARIFLAQNEDDFIGTGELKVFFSKVQAYYCEATTQIKKRLPFGDAVLKDLTVLDPEKRLVVTSTAVVRLASRFSQHFSADDIDSLIDEFHEYQHMNLNPDCLDKTKTPVDVFWHEHSCLTRGGSQRFKYLPKLMKMMLSLPHSNASAERIFSMVKLIKTDSRNRLLSLL